MILYRIVTTQHVDTDTVYQLYRTSLVTCLLVILPSEVKTQDM